MKNKFIKKLAKWLEVKEIRRCNYCDKKLKDGEKQFYSLTYNGLKTCNHIKLTKEEEKRRWDNFKFQSMCRKAHAIEVDRHYDKQLIAY